MLEKTKNYLMKEYSIDQSILNFCEKIEREISGNFNKIDEIKEYNQLKVLHAMQEIGLGDRHFSYSTGYGYDDIGREAIEKVYARVFNTEDALVRPHIISGTHALSLCLSGILRPGDELLSITGKPYDTLEDVIGISNIEYGQGSLKDFGITYKQIDLLRNGEVNITKVMETISSKTKLIFIQRSTGYEWRKAVTVNSIKKVVEKIKPHYPNIVIMVDNCYGEFIESLEPTDVGVDVIAGSLIKNPGGGLAPTGGYIVGRKDLIEIIANRLASPGLGKEAGATLGVNRLFFQGLFLAPHIVAEALKVAVYGAKIFEELGFEVCPRPDDERSDIIQGIKLGTAENIITFCNAIQGAAPVDSYVSPEPWEMPGYNDPIIMAAGAFIQGSSIELSADAPIKEPFAAYLQGGLTFEHGKIGLYLVLQSLANKNIIKI
ncbi:MAG TPA: hypothetical protein GXZ78_01950 [Eubacteriaceae bacterium]|nr:hypothetical protein [Eubacteriaceae bacterium]